MKILLTFCSAHHPRRFERPHYHVGKKKLPPGHPQSPKVPPLGHDPGNRMKILSDMFCIFHFVRVQTKFDKKKSLKLTVVEIK